MKLIQFEDLSTEELLEYISLKTDFDEEAKCSFVVFVHRFEKDLLEKAEIYCSKFGYNEVIALDVVKCTFDRVWKYPSFDKNKASVKNIDKAIVLWMYRILYTQIILLKDRESCAEPTDEEDLSLVHNIHDLVSRIIPSDQVEKTKELKNKLNFLENALAGLSDKHRIIFFTYKAYEKEGKNIPRSVSKLLQERLDIVPSTIRVYKLEATKHINDYIQRINGK
jgi:hypothetical protein